MGFSYFRNLLIQSVHFLLASLILLFKTQLSIRTNLRMRMVKLGSIHHQKLRRSKPTIRATRSSRPLMMLIWMILALLIPIPNNLRLISLYSLAMKLTKLMTIRLLMWDLSKASFRQRMILCSRKIQTLL